jgi:hypothetical protein
MANFDSSDDVDPGEDGDDARPRLASVKLRGQQLQDHPEVCSRIVERAHLKDVEFCVRKDVDRKREQSTLIRVRLVWERDHIAVLTGADDDKFDIELHRRLVQLVRNAAERPLSTELLPMLRRVEARAKESDVAAGAAGVIAGSDNGPLGPDGEVAVTSVKGVP